MKQSLISINIVNNFEMFIKIDSSHHRHTAANKANFPYKQASQYYPYMLVIDH